MLKNTGPGSDSTRSKHYAAPGTSKPHNECTWLFGACTQYLGLCTYLCFITKIRNNHYTVNLNVGLRVYYVSVFNFK
jgi:hypothetical protein